MYIQTWLGTDTTRMKLSDKLKKQIKNQSTKSQESYAGLMTDLRVKYKPYSNTGLKAMEMLYDIASGAEADTLDGLKTRLVRLDQLREYLLKTSLEPREQKKVFAAYTKVQSAVRNHKDQYDKKFAGISKLLDGASSNIVNALDSAFDEFPLFKAMLNTGTFAARKIKEQRQKRAQTLRSRNDVLRKDSEQMYARELEKENDVKPGKGKGGSKGGKNFFTRPTPKMSGVEYVHDNTAQAYTAESGGAGMEYMQDMAQNIAAIKDVVTTELLHELRELNKYNSWQKTQTKDRKLDDLEATREASRNNPLKLVRERTTNGQGVANGESANSGGGIVDTALDMLGMGAAAKGAGKLGRSVFKGAGKAVKGVGGLLKGAGALAAGGLAGKALGGVAKMGGKSLLKKIPLIGLGAGGIFALQRALSGDFKGAGLELASGAAGTLPGLGTAASVGIDAALAAKDAGLFDGAAEQPGATNVAATAAPAGAQNQRASLVPLASLTRNMDIKDVLGADGKGLGLLFPLKSLDAITAIATGGASGGTPGGTQTRPGGIQRDSAPGQAREQLDTARRARKSVERRFDNKIRQAASKGDTQEVARLQAQKGASLSGMDSNRIAPLEKKAAASATGKMLGKSAPAPEAYSGELGGISKKYESGSLGAGAVSSGRGDPGGASYGTYQLASKTGTLQKFLSSSGYGEQFAGMDPGSAEFNSKWKEVAKSDPSFGKSQHEFIKKTHYDPAIKKAAELGYNVNDPRVQEAVWSGSVQHGGINKILSRAAGSEGFSNMSAEDQVKSFYETRSQYTDSLSGVSHAAGRGRYDREMKDVLNMKMPETKGDVIAPEAIKPTAPIVQASAAGAKPTAPIIPVSQNQSGGVQGVDYAVDPDTGEKFYYDSDMKQSMQQERSLLQENNPQMTPNQQTVAEGSKSTALAMATPQTPAIMPVAGPGPTINMSSSSDGQTNTDTGTDSRRKSYVEAVNA